MAAAALIGLLGAKLLRGASHWVAVLGVAGAAAAAATLLVRVLPGLEGEMLSGSFYRWFLGSTGAGGFLAHVAFRYDPLTALMLVTVTGVSLCVAVYSRDYMRGDRGYARYFAYISLFVFSMCTLVLAGNFLLLYVGWELVGLCSYLLIGFYYDKPSASAAAKKAFIVNRVGDFGFGLGVLLIWLTFGSLQFDKVLDPSAIAAVPAGRLAAIALLLLCGAVGKSAQLPLHVWLPDAMEGPSPVSALIHAATMVTAGVYMVARSLSLFDAAGVLPVVAILGAGTALFAATIALVNRDLKRILAYSTISQLGYMFLGLGAAAGGAAVFHLFTHAFFKALLFLGAGAVMHATAGVLDLDRMGGLWRKLPLTAITFAAGCVALAGIPGTAGYFSKDQIIAAAYVAPGLGQLGPILGGVGLFTAALTAFYTFRMLMRVFAGPEKLPEETHGHLHAPGAWMCIVLVVLAVPSLAAGFLEHRVAELLGGGPCGLTGPAEHPHWLPPVASGLAVGAALLAVLLYGPLRTRTLASRIGQTFGYRLLTNKYYIDELYDWVIVRPARWVGRACTAIDDHGIDNILLGITWIPRGIGRGLRTAQRSSLGGYALAFVLGAVLLIAALMLLR